MPTHGHSVQRQFGRAPSNAFHPAAHSKHHHASRAWPQCAPHSGTHVPALLHLHSCRSTVGCTLPPCTATVAGAPQCNRRHQRPQCNKHGRRTRAEALKLKSALKEAACAKVQGAQPWTLSTATANKPIHSAPMPELPQQRTPSRLPRPPLLTCLCLVVAAKAGQTNHSLPGTNSMLLLY